MHKREFHQGEIEYVKMMRPGRGCLFGGPYGCCVSKNLSHHTASLLKNQGKWAVLWMVLKTIACDSHRTRWSNQLSNLTYLITYESYLSCSTHCSLWGRRVELDRVFVLWCTGGIIPTLMVGELDHSNPSTDASIKSGQVIHKKALQRRHWKVTQQGKFWRRYLCERNSKGQGFRVGRYLATDTFQYSINIELQNDTG